MGQNEATHRLVHASRYELVSKVVAAESQSTQARNTALHPRHHLSTPYRVQCHLQNTDNVLVRIHESNVPFCKKNTPSHHHGKPCSIDGKPKSSQSRLIPYKAEIKRLFDFSHIPRRDGNHAVVERHCLPRSRILEYWRVTSPRRTAALRPPEGDRRGGRVWIHQNSTPFIPDRDGRTKGILLVLVQGLHFFDIVHDVSTNEGLANR